MPDPEPTTTPMERPTPETDAQVEKQNPRGTWCDGKIYPDFARQMERQRDEAREMAARLIHSAVYDYWVASAEGTLPKKAQEVVSEYRAFAATFRKLE